MGKNLNLLFIKKMLAAINSKGIALNLILKAKTE